MLATSENLQQLHADHVLTPWSIQKASHPPMIVRAQGVYYEDADGKRYLDLSSGLIAVNLGHGHPAVVKAIQDQAAKLCYAPPSFANDVRAELAKELSTLSPWDEGARSFFTTSGADANEDAIKMARMRSGRLKILTAYRSFHGSTIGASTLTGENRRWAAEPGIPGIVHFFSPYPYRSPFHTDDAHEESKRALEHLELILMHEDPTRVAAIMIEPVVGSNGVIVYPAGYLEGVRRLCDRHGILLIFDEVMTGFGRVGAAFAAQRFGVAPDMITFAKGVTSAYIPLGGVLVRESLAAHFDSNMLWCGHTYAGHPLAMAAALAALRAYRDEHLFERANQIETWLRDALGTLKQKHAIIGDVRGVGAMFAIELVKDRKSKEPLVPWHGAAAAVMKNFFSGLLRRGVYAFGRFNVIMVAPPLIIHKSELDAGIAALDETLAEIATVSAS
ncbi:MAG: aminotransferase class III-fold pyridoxal phosphate-dependent enzyme [Candidatus Eremiobacteraeota bacterium]|nr:aminotransferase class III-fold pyridoxal phosphate-dependent enzyme [Candidatus Eremiobacteraeota bacterium]